MLHYLLGIFLILHGGVYLLYTGQSLQIFELRQGMTWPAGAWVLSKSLGDELTRRLASIIYVLVAVSFVTGGISLIAQREWGFVVVRWVAIAASVFTVLFWDGKFEALYDKGGIGILINIAILMLVMFWR